MIYILWSGHKSHCVRRYRIVIDNPIGIPWKKIPPVTRNVIFHFQAWKIPTDCNFSGSQNIMKWSEVRIEGRKTWFVTHCNFEWLKYRILAISFSGDTVSNVALFCQNCDEAYSCAGKDLHDYRVLLCQYLWQQYFRHLWKLP